MVSAFQTEPLTDFGNPANVSAFEYALATVKAQLGHSYPMLIDGRDVPGEREFTSINPADPDVIVGRFLQADRDDAVKAIEAADRAFIGWSRVPAEKRAGFLFEAAARIRRRRHEFSAWMVYEVGKSWAEADGEVAECIDLMEYYGRQMFAFDGPQNDRLGRVPNENTDFFYIPLGRESLSRRGISAGSHVRDGDGGDRGWKYGRHQAGEQLTSLCMSTRTDIR